MHLKLAYSATGSVLNMAVGKFAPKVILIVKKQRLDYLELYHRCKKCN